MERRDTRRVIYRKRIKHGMTKPEFYGYVLNISRNGLKLESRRIFPPGTKVVIDFLRNENETNSTDLCVQGVVKWSTRYLPGLPSRMGIKLLDVEGNYVQQAYEEKAKER